MLCELILLNYLTDGHNVTPPQQMGYNQATRIYVGTKKKLTNHVESLSRAPKKLADLGVSTGSRGRLHFFIYIYVYRYLLCFICLLRWLSYLLLLILDLVICLVTCLGLAKQSRWLLIM